jgi:hypothetical protein
VKRKKYLKLIGIYVVMAVLIIMLYAPWALALRPNDPRILFAGLSIVCAVALATTFVTATYLTLREPPTRHVDLDTVDDIDDVIPLLETYANIEHTSAIASRMLEQTRSAKRKRHRLAKAISSQFEPKSMTWSKFDDAAEQALVAIAKNAAVVCNYLQSFDQQDYRREKTTDAERERLRAHCLARIDDIADKNEKILASMSRLELELSELGIADATTATDATTETLRQLIEETEYYQ